MCSINKYSSSMKYLWLDHKVKPDQRSQEAERVLDKKVKIFHLVVLLFKPFAIYYIFHQLSTHRWLLLQKITCIDYPFLCWKNLTSNRFNLMKYKGIEEILFLQIIWTELEWRTKPQKTYWRYLHGFQTILSTVCTLS